MNRTKTYMSTKAFGLDKMVSCMYVAMVTASLSLDTRFSKVYDALKYVHITVDEYNFTGLHKCRNGGGGV